jgi:hypothetical protein
MMLVLDPRRMMGVMRGCFGPSVIPFLNHPLALGPRESSTLGTQLPQLSFRDLLRK